MRKRLKIVFLVEIDHMFLHINNLWDPLEGRTANDK